MSSFARRVFFFVTLTVCIGCSQQESAQRRPVGWEGVCVDDDGDGFGFQCSSGADCDDTDANIHAGCARCAKPDEGCACTPGTAAISCTVEPELTESGDLLCHEGTRYCRDGAWSGCEGVSSFVAPLPEQVGVSYQALIEADAAVKCGTCDPDCKRVNDPLSPFDAGAGSGITSRPQGGITLSGGGDGGASSGGDGIELDDYDCEPGSPPDVDCDRVPDDVDDTPSGAPFSTSHKTVFMKLAPGQTGTEELTVNFDLASADIYFYLDMTGSMESERDNLIASLTAGNYLPASVAGQDCADRDLDGSPDNYLKNLGVAGNIACLIRDARFGSGWFRDLPFSGHGAVDFEMFEHRLDITDDVGAVKSSLERFDTRGGVDMPEGSAQGLWALPTSGEVYAGWDRPGIPSRVSCPPGTWGHACFRDGAVPIIIHVTDDGMNNGPPTTSGYYPFSYSSLSKDIRVATPDGSGRYLRPLSSAAETFANAQDMGTVDGRFITYAGSTEKMGADLTYLTTGNCPSGSAWDLNSQTGRDAVFKFTVGSRNGTSNRSIKLSSSGSRFNSSLMLLGTPPTYTGISAANNGTFASATDLGTIAPGRLVISSDTRSAPSVYAREGLTTNSGCFVGPNANDRAPASVLKFKLAADQSLRFTSSAGSPVNTSLFMSSALEPETTDMSSIDCGGGVSANCNDKIGQLSVGELKNAHAHLVGASTASSNVSSNYSAEFASCGGATYADAGDQVYDFTLSSPTTVRIETSGSGSNLQANFPHGIAVVRKPTAVGTTRSVPNGNTDQATAYTILESDIPAPGTFARYEGNSASDTPTYSQAEVGGATAGICHNGNAGGATADKDVVFKFVVTATQKYEFDTAPSAVTSGYKTWLSLHRGSIGRSMTTPITNTAVLDTAAGQPVAALSQGLSIDNRQVVLTNGQIEQRDNSYPPNITGNYCGSTSNSPGSRGGRDAVFRFYAATSGKVTITTVNAAGQRGTTPSFDSYFAVYDTTISNATRVTDNCPTPSLLGLFGPPSNQPGNGWTETIDTVAGREYLVVVKEWAYDTSPSSTSGRFGLIIEDSRFAGSFLGCDAGSSPSGSNFSRLSATLTPGTYYLVLKGTGSGGNRNYALNVRKPGATTAGTTVACANSSSDRAIIPSLALGAGEYSVIVKGQRTRNCLFFICSNEEHEGDYNLTIRDLAVAPVPLACNNTTSAASMTPPLLRKNDSGGNPITYYLVTRGNTAGSANQVMIEDASSPSPGAGLACDDDSGQVLNGEITRALAPGTYYAVLKGRTQNDFGMFQMSIGEDRSGVTSTGTFAPKSWAGTGGVRQALIDEGVHVISVNSIGTANMFRGSPAYQQTLVLARDTGGPTISANETYEITTDGTGMGSAVISAVNDLANSLSLDLGLKLVPIEPNVPAKPFKVVVQALPGSGNCSPPVDTDMDGIADTFTACRPGAVPSFKIQITNPPAPNNVPSSTLDPYGGYKMKLQLIGDRKFVVDEVPVYLIPQNTSGPGTGSQYASSGNYEQIVKTNCSGTDAPLWRSLRWNSSLPAGTSIDWSLCASNDAAALSSCTLGKVASVSSGDMCTTSAQCPAGYCAASGVCEYVVGHACQDTAECGSAGLCSAGTCRWTQNQIDLTAALPQAQQGLPMMRVNLQLNASSDRQRAPVVGDWQLDYVCTPQF